ncbi:MAG TPA: hypothetical protein PKK26_09900 [Candidatus Wallbacteria bacterium]|nr:hypothetical protein [Candidatus Wallbacteria bacterium]
MSLKLIYENTGLSMATYDEGYISLVEEAVESGKKREIKDGGGSFYVIKNISAPLDVFVYSRDGTIFHAIPFYECRMMGLTAEIEFPEAGNGLFGEEKTRGFVSAKVYGKNPEAGFFKIYPEAVNANIYKNAPQSYFSQKRLKLELNAQTVFESLKVYGDEAEYYSSKPIVPEKAIIALKFIDREETPAENMPYAHITGKIHRVENVLNAYTREFFRVISLKTLNDIEICVLSRRPGAKETDPLKDAGAGRILECDVYFTCRF